MTAPMRDTQLSLVDGMERPIGPIPPSVQTGTNADLMLRIAPLYLTGSVLDVTYGKGNWWAKFTPDPFTFHDLHTVDGVDFRALPHDDNSFDTVCFDPPYIPQGGDHTTSSTAPAFTQAFGLEKRTEAVLWDLIRAGLAECDRVARRFVLVKCMDFVNAGRFNLGHLNVLDASRDLGMACHDLIVHNAGTGPGEHNITEIKRERRSHSYLLTFTPSDSGSRKRPAEQATNGSTGDPA